MAIDRTYPTVELDRLRQLQHIKSTHFIFLQYNLNMNTHTRTIIHSYDHVHTHPTSMNQWRSYSKIWRWATKETVCLLVFS
jgi:hypothetical protein